MTSNCGDSDARACTYYSFSCEKKFRCLERKFRIIQSCLLLFLVFCFIFYIITLGIDIAKFWANLPYLFIALIIDLIAMIFIALGVRGVALELLPLVLALTIAMVVVTVAHAVTFLFRHPGLNSANLAFDTLLSLCAILYTCLLCRFEKLKPPNYDIGLATSQATAVTEDQDAVTTGLTSLPTMDTELSLVASPNSCNATKANQQAEDNGSSGMGGDITGSGIDSGKAPMANFSRF